MWVCTVYIYIYNTTARLSFFSRDCRHCSTCCFRYWYLLIIIFFFFSMYSSRIGDILLPYPLGFIVKYIFLTWKCVYSVAFFFVYWKSSENSNLITSFLFLSLSSQGYYMNKRKSKSTWIEQHTLKIVNPLVNFIKVHCHVYQFIWTLKVLSIKMSILIYFSSGWSYTYVCRRRDKSLPSFFDFFWFLYCYYYYSCWWVYFEVWSIVSFI